MLWSIDKDEAIKTIPHEATYRIWRNRLPPAELRKIQGYLNGKIDADIAKGTDIQTSSWIPGRDWSGTVFMPIYETACLKNPGEAAKCFGIILWEVMMNRPEKWAFGRYKLKDVNIEGMTYFRIDKGAS